MDRTLITELQGQVRVIGEDDGRIQLGVLTENQDALAWLTPEERDQIVAWLQYPNTALVVQ
jgi:hypothetical protein